MTRRLVLTLIMVLLLTASSVAQVSVAFLDVGQGDAILITTAQGASMLVDGGTEKAGHAVVVPHLQARGIMSLDIVVATHPHADHIGGLIPVLQQFEVSELWADAQVHTTRTYERFLTIIDEQGIPFRQAKAGVTLELPGIDSIRVLHPQQNFLSGLNNNSVVILVTVGQISFLLTGDIEREAEHVLVTSGLDLQADILKVAHHGSSSSSTPPFVDAVNPRLAVIMAGEGNRYGHPHVSTLVTLGDIPVYRTDLHGTIIVHTDGVDYSIETQETPITLDHRINLNQATVEELVQVPGIGPVLAERIQARRQKQPFTDVAQLTEIHGIGPATLERVRGYFYVTATP